MNEMLSLQRIGVKLFAEPATEVALAEFIPIFHRWIQTRAVDGLLVDVADYSHVDGGPGILLVAHEANYVIDCAAGRMGLACHRKRPLPGDLPERMAEIARITFAASRELEEAPELGGRLQFGGDEFLLVADDRLLAPNTEDTLERLRPALDSLSRRIFPGAAYELAREPDPKERFAVTVKATASGSVRELLDRLDS